MEKIKIGSKDPIYEIESIRPVSGNVMQLVFAGAIPPNWGDITIYTDDGTEATTITGYETVYRDEGHTVYLSNDGSVYTAPETPEGPGEPPEPYVPTLEELQAAKRREISTACQQIIYQGINVPLSDGSTDHFSLTIEDGQPCRFYSAEDMQAIITAAMWHVSYHTTYCNAINMWIADCQTTEEVQAISYGADVPTAYQSEVLQSYLAQIAAMAGGAEDDKDHA